jgi:hypothetical protein
MRIRVWLSLGLVLGVLSPAASGCSCSDDDKDRPAGTGGTGATGGTDSGTGGTAGTTGLDMWTAWERIQVALRASPDHLPARADAVVDTKDPQQIFEFVRDNIATYPPEMGSLYGADVATRWGVRGTLRGGAGTPRERAELLVSLYEKAGLEAEVVVGAPDPAKIDGKKILLRTFDIAHAPTFTPTEASEWATALGHETLLQASIIDADGSKGLALANQLIGALPTDLTTPFDFTLGTIPLVRVNVSGTWQYANPLTPDAAFGDSLTLAEPTPTGAAYPGQGMKIVLQAARADDPYARFTLVEKTFQAEDLVGRRVQLAFPPPLKPENLAVMRAADLETFVPVLSVVGPDMTVAEQEALAVAGDMFSLGGDQYTELPGGGFTVNGEELADVDTDPATLAKVTTVNIRANASAFRRVGVTVSALDSTGKNVPRLGADAFEVKEDDKLVSFSLSRNEAPPPRVVLLYDTSTSMPAQFLGAGAVSLGNQIVGPLYAKYPAAQVRVASVNFGANWMGGTWATTLSEAQAQVAGLATAPGASEIWRTLYDAEKEKPTVILLLTDGAATDTAEPQYLQAIAAGVPVLSIGAGTVTQATLDQISELSGGKSVPVTQLSQATTAALAEIDARAVEDYVLAYEAPKGTATTRNVTVTINAKTGSDSYEVPATPVLPKALSGLYLTIEVAGRAHTAPIAGFRLGYSTAFPNVTQAMLDDTHALLLGRVAIQVEGASPSYSVVLDDWIAEKLALRPLMEAVESKDNDQIIEALNQGFSRSPAKLMLSQPPLRDARSTQSLTYETSPRIAAMIQKFSPSGAVSRQLSLFPLSQWATAAEDARAAWEKTLTASAGLAILEAETFSGPSTYEDLQSKTLTMVDPGQANEQAGLTPEEMLAWDALESEFNADYKLLVPEKPGPFWAVDEITGSVVGMLPNGTGSGAEDICNDYDLQNDIAQMMSLLGSMFGVSVGGWVALAQWEIKYVTMATLVIGYGATAGDLSNPAAEMGCGMLNDALGGLGQAGSIYGTYDAAAGTYNATNPDSASAPTLCGGISNYNPCH